MIRLENVNKFFNKHKRNQIHVINNTSLELGDKGLVALLGPSGCGKTTLLNAIGGLDKISKGKILINNERIAKRRSGKVDKIRNLNIGYIFQDYYLIDDETVYNNIALSLKLIGIKDKKEIDDRIKYVLEKVGMYKYRNRLASMLSGGQRQRVAIARAIVKNPNIILADEPTGNLDSKNTIEIMNIIASIAREKLVILVTHETELADFYASRIIKLEDGKVISDTENNNIQDLDYKIDNKIYLKDFNRQELYQYKNFNLNLYSNDENIHNINLVIQNGNIYIESKDNEKIEIIDSNSSIELVNDHYKKLSKEEMDKYIFDFEKHINNNYKIKYSSVYNTFNSIKYGFNKLLNYSFIKKILLLGFFASAMFITFSVSSIFGIFNINEDMFVSINKNYLTVSMKNIKLSNYKKYESDNDLYYILPGNSITNFYVLFDDYYQSKDNFQSFSGSLSSKSMISDKDILLGKNISNKNEIVVDKKVLESFINNSSAKQLGYTLESFINKKTYIGYTNYMIVGICDSKSPSIYASDNELINILINNEKEVYPNIFNQISYDDVSNIYNYIEYKDKIKLKKGNYPTKDYEVIVNNNYNESIKIGDKLDYEVNKKKLKVVGFYESNKYNLYLTNESTLKYQFVEGKNDLVFYPKDKNATLEKYKLLNLNINDSYTYSRDKYVKERNEDLKGTLIFGGIILAISLIEIYLMIRSSFLSRIREVGIYRAIGMKKRDIYKMFVGEILAITSTSSILGVAFMSYILYELSSISYISNLFVINSETLTVTIVFVYAFNIIFGLLPVKKVLMSTPARILSRSDI